MQASKYFLVSAIIGLGAIVAAQGTYTTFGQSCPNSALCGSANPGTSTLRRLLQNTSTFALLVQASPSSRYVGGFEMFAHAADRTAPFTIETYAYAADARGQPTGAPLETGFMTIGKDPGWYRTVFSAPLLVPPNTKIFLSYAASPGQMWLPIAEKGTSVTHFYRPPASAMWVGPFETQPWAWKLLCVTGPRLTFSGVPTLNDWMSIDLVNAGPNRNAVLAFGVSDTNWHGLPLPLDIGAMAPGCNVYVSLDILYPRTTSPDGSDRFMIRVPNDPALKGIRFFNQFGVDAPDANPMGIVFTNGGAGRIG